MHLQQLMKLVKIKREISKDKEIVISRLLNLTWKWSLNLGGLKVFYNTDKNVYNTRILKFSSFQFSSCFLNILYNKARNNKNIQLFIFVTQIGRCQLGGGFYS